MRIFSVLITVFAIVASAGADDSHGGHEHPEPSGIAATEIHPEPNQLVIQVNGLVCSFCAHGAEKALSKLEGLDKKLFEDGVLVDIEKQLVTLAWQSESTIPFREVFRRVKKAGYDPVRFHFRVSGQLSDDDRLAAESPKQDFTLLNKALPNAGPVDLRVHSEAARIESLADGAPIPITIDEVL